MTLSKATLVQAIRIVSKNADSFDQVTKGLCKRLYMILKPAPDFSLFTTNDIQATLNAHNFDPTFIAKLLETIKELNK